MSIHPSRIHRWLATLGALLWVAPLGVAGCASDEPPEKKPMQPTERLEADDQKSIRDRANEDQDHLDDVMDREEERLRDERSEATEMDPAE